MLIVLLSSPLFAESKVALGYKADWQLSRQIQLDLFLDIYNSLSEDNVYQPIGQIRWMHFMDQKQLLQLFLDGEVSEEQLYMLFGYKTPITEQVELSAGIGFEKNINTSGSLFFIDINSEWSTEYGMLNFQSIVGDVEEQLSAHYYYPLEKYLTEKISVGGQVGIQYHWQSDQSILSLPVLLNGTYHFDEAFRLKLQANDTCTYIREDGSSDTKNELIIGLYLESSFDTSPSKRQIRVEEGKGYERQVIQSPVSGSSLPQEETTDEGAQDQVVESIPHSQGELVNKEELYVLDRQQTDEKIVPQKQATKEVPVNFYDPSNEILCYNNQLVKVNALDRDHSYLPLREVIQSLGGDVFWHNSDQQICIVLDENRVFLDVQSSTCLQNGETLSLGEMILEKDHYYVQYPDLMKILGHKDCLGELL